MCFHRKRKEHKEREVGMEREREREDLEEEEGWVYRIYRVEGREEKERG